MLLKALTLRNIRSYVEQQIELPAGSLVLSGDIGCGKSTILLAIEFALFGLLRGDVEGAALLRNGAREGSVELTFSLENQEYTVKRTLKRQKDKVAQDAGLLIQNGLQKEGTAQELRAWILDILGYPKEFLTKSKALLFRYTVFTPQEEMKRILFEEKDARLETLRKVFNVDKYKRVKENTQIFVRQLKEERKNLEGFTQDLEAKRNLLTLKREEALSVRQRAESTGKELEAARARTLAQRALVARYEETVKNGQRIRTELGIVQGSIAQQQRTLERMQDDHRKLLAQQALLEKELQDSPGKLEDIRTALGQKNAQMLELEKTIRSFHAAIAQLSTTKTLSEELKAKVASMNHCPTCLQMVTQDHKNRISFAEDQKVRELQRHLDYNTTTKEQLETQLILMRQELEKLRHQEQQTLLLIAKQKAFADITQQVASRADAMQQAQMELKQLQNKQQELTALADSVAGAEREAAKARLQLDAVLAEERTFDINYHRFLKELEGIESFASTVQEDVNRKEQAKAKLQKTIAVQGWLTDQFGNLLDVMEKHVLARVHREFNDLFQRWFAILVEDELLAAHLDDTFSPVIVQNGYEVDVANLSGGEKTACALAYRLALNKVINDVISTIKTKDLLILDEPTDGFSTEQLDKIRDVLEQLHLKQVIIVSHESKIESMVENVMRVEKEGHVSRLIA
ncbi:MAG TPA: SMC family ATPase [Candidatus Binatia bacterium]|nr:SMC family ATPase [Candidatus Binatia bacterium]